MPAKQQALGLDRPSSAVQGLIQRFDLTEARGEIRIQDRVAIFGDGVAQWDNHFVCRANR